MADFLYCGLSFYHLKTRVPQHTASIVEVATLADIVESGGVTMQEVIHKDLQLLGASQVGKKDKRSWGATGSFIKLKLANDANLYIYHHRQHASFSCTYLSQLISCGIVDDSSTSTAAKVPTCTLHSHHDHLQPFFLGNQFLLDYFKECGRDDTRPKQDLVKGILEGTKNAQGTPFECPEGPACNWTENDWTKRLARGLQEFLPEATVVFSAFMGISFRDVLASLKVPFAPEACYLFRGAPDILICKRHVVMTSSQDASMSSSEDDIAIENCHQRPPLTGYTEFHQSEKLGELIAALHCVLVSKLLRKINKGKSITSNIEVKGLLLDKVIGVTQCILSVECLTTPCKVHIHIIDYTGSHLTPNSLCFHISSLVHT